MSYVIQTEEEEDGGSVRVEGVVHTLIDQSFVHKPSRIDPKYQRVHQRHQWQDNVHADQNLMQNIGHHALQHYEHLQTLESLILRWYLYQSITCACDTMR
jgi:hypothetical protein